MSESNPNSVVAVGNSILYYAEIDNAGVVELQKCLYELRDAPKIYLHIHSYGGDAYLGTLLYDIIRKATAVTTIIDGIAGSAAAYMFLGASERYMRPHSYLMIHQISHAVEGTHRQIQDEVRSNAMLMANLVQILTDNSSLSARRIKKYLEGETYINAADAAIWGLSKGQPPESE